jgi:hypothetical protein
MNVGPDALARWFTHPALDEGGAVMAARSAEWTRAIVPVAIIALVGLVVLLRRTARSSATGGSVAPLPAAPDRPSRHEVLGLVAIVLVAAIVRVDRAVESLWYDEIAAFMDYAQHGPGPIVASWFSPANHPLQSLLSWCSCTVLGVVNEFSLRLPSLLAALATVVATWWMARPILGARAALLAAAGMAIAPAAVLGSVEARGYSMMMLAGALLTGLAWRLVEQERRGDATTRWWIVYALIAALGVWAHFTTVVVPLAHGVLAVALFVRGDRAVARRWLVALVLAAVATLMLLAPMLPWILERRAELAALDGDEPTLWSLEGLAILGTWGGAWPWWPSIAGGGLALIGAHRLWRTGQRGALALVLLPFLMALVVPLAGSWIYARFVAFALPGAALLWGAGLDRLVTRRRALGLGVGGVVAASWLLLLVDLPPKQPLRDALAVAAAEPGPVIVVGLPDEVARFYAEPMGIDARYARPYGEDLEALLASTPGARVLVLYPGAMPASVQDTLSARGLARTHELAGWADWGAGRVELHAAREGRPAAR